MTLPANRFASLRGRLLVLLTLAVTGLATSPLWWTGAQDLIRRIRTGQPPGAPVDAHDDGHDHADDEMSWLELSAQARANLGLTPEFVAPISLTTYRRSIRVPGIVVERPGRTRVKISTPMAGVITHVHAVQGEAVDPGTLLFQLRITAEELVSTQTDLLRTAGELDVEQREVVRLQRAAESGAVPQKTLLERQYAAEKLAVLLNVQREALRLHGLSERQIDDIVTHRRLLRDLQILAPERDSHDGDELHLSDARAIPASWLSSRDEAVPVPGHPSVQTHRSDVLADVPLILQEVLVHKGETVAAGTTLAVLADHSELYIEGRAFEQDTELLTQSGQEHRKIDAVFHGAGESEERVAGLDLVYAASQIDEDSRTLSFFVRLPNHVTREVPSPNGQRFLEWKYRPGQRLQLLVPVEEWADQIVLPVEAIAQEGAESYVFRQNGRRFRQIPVHVKFRDSAHVVIAADGQVAPRDLVALRSAHQMQMALRNKSGGGIDPHAGHNH